VSYFRHSLRCVWWELQKTNKIIKPAKQTKTRPSLLLSNPAGLALHNQLYSDGRQAARRESKFMVQDAVPTRSVSGWAWPSRCLVGYLFVYSPPQTVILSWCFRRWAPVWAYAGCVLLAAPLAGDQTMIVGLVKRCYGRSDTMFGGHFERRLALARSRSLVHIRQHLAGRPPFVRLAAPADQAWWTDAQRINLNQFRCWCL
jgi:hypothetical protein